MMVKVMCQLGWSKECPDSWENIISVCVSVRVFLKGITSFWFSDQVKISALTSAGGDHLIH